MSNANLGTGTFYLTGNASGATNAANQANNALSRLEQSAAQNWWGIRNLGLAFAALPAAVAAGTGAAIKSAVTWEDALAGVARTTYDLDKSLEENRKAAGQLGKELLDLSKSLPTDAGTLAQIAEAAGALGVAQPDVAQFTETVANLSATTDLTADAAAVGIARIAALTGVGAAGFDNLASSITTTGTATAATESDIVSMATRIAPAAKIVGLTADQVLGLAAATRSAGVQSQEGGTAIQKTFLDMNAAVRANGDELRGWAALAGQETEAFRAAFANNAGNAFASVIVGMGNMTASGQNVVGLLDELGIKEARQQKTLLALSATQHQNVNENFQLTKILGIASDSFQDTEQYAAMLERRYNTTANQLKILRNMVFAGAVAFGNMLNPVIRRTVDFLQLLVATIANAPGPFKAVLAIFIGLATALSGIAAVALLVGPRILIATGALRQMMQASQEAAMKQLFLSASMQKTTASMLGQVGMSRAVQRQLGVQGRQAVITAIQQGNLAKVEQVLATRGLTLASAGVTVTTTMGTMARMAGILSAAFGYVTLAITAATLAMAYFNQNSQRHQKVLEASGRARLDLVQAMRNEAKGQTGASRALIEAMPQYQRLAQVAATAGVSQQDLYDTITGSSADLNHTGDVIRTLADANLQVSDDGTTAGEMLQVLNNQWNNSAQEAGVMAGALDDVNLEMADVGENAEKGGKALQKFADAVQKVVDATTEHVDAVRAQRDAYLGVADAQRDLVDAQEELARNDEKIAAAERDLTAARFDAIDAIQAVADAEQKLADAQQDANDAVAEAEDSLADLRDRRADTTDRIVELEEKLTDARANNGLKEIIKATNKLRDAQLSLLKANRQVADAEWQLQYLREEGASNRDITDAEITLQDARNDQAEQTEDVADAQEELNDAMDEAKRLREIAGLERDLASARRDLEEITRNTRDAEHELREARLDASGRLIEERERNLERARLDAAQAADDVRNSERDLTDARGKETQDAIREVEDAERNLEDSLWDLAEATTEVQKQEALMRGEQWDAARSARALATNMGALTSSLPNADAIARVSTFLDELRNVPSIPIVPEGDTLFDMPSGGAFPDLSGLAADYGSDMGHIIADAIAEAIKEGKDEHKDSWYEQLWDWLFDTSKWGAFWQEVGGRGYDLIIGLWNGIKEGGKAIINGIKQKFYEWVINPLADTFQMRSPSKLMFNFGLDIIQGLWNGLVKRGEELLGWVIGFPLRFISKLGDPLKWLWDHGVKIVSGLWQGIEAGSLYLWNSLWGWTGDILGEIWDGLFGFAGDVFDIGRDIVDEIWQGIVNMTPDFIRNWGRWIQDNIIDRLGDAIDTGAGWLDDLLPGDGFNPLDDLHNPFARHPKALQEGIDKQSKAVASGFVKTTGFTPDEMFAADRYRSALAGGSSMPVPSGVVNNYGGDTIHITTQTNASPEDIVNAYLFSKRVRVRR